MLKPIHIYELNGLWTLSEPSNFLLVYFVMSQLMQDQRGDTALFAASQEGHYDPAALLIKHRADVNRKNNVRP